MESTPNRAPLIVHRNLGGVSRLTVYPRWQHMEVRYSRDYCLQTFMAISVGCAMSGVDCTLAETLKK